MVLAAVVLLAVGCGDGQGTEGVVVVGDDGVPPKESAPPLSTAPAAGDEPPPTTQAIPTGPGGLAHCDDVPKLASSFEGTLSGRRNPDLVIKRALSAYGREHPDTYAGQWIDRDNGGVLMMGFTDDPEPHRAAILARRPSPDDDPDGGGRHSPTTGRWASAAWRSTWCRSGSARPRSKPSATR